MPRMMATITGSNVACPWIMNGQTLSAAAHMDIIVRARQRRMPQTGETAEGLATGKSISDAPSMQCKYSAQAYSRLAVEAFVSIDTVLYFLKKVSLLF